MTTAPAGHLERAQRLGEETLGPVEPVRVGVREAQQGRGFEPHDVPVQPMPGARRPLTRARSQNSTISSALSPRAVPSKARSMSRIRSELSWPVRLSAIAARRRERAGPSSSTACTPSQRKCAVCSRRRAGPGSVRSASAATTCAACLVWLLWVSAWESRKTASTRSSLSRPGRASAARRCAAVVAGEVSSVAQPSSYRTLARTVGNGGSSRARSRQRLAASGAPTARCSAAASRNCATSSGSSSGWTWSRCGAAAAAPRPSMVTAQAAWPWNAVRVAGGTAR